MKKHFNAKVLVALAAAVCLFGAGIAVGAGFGKPKTVMHVVTIKWKAGAAKEDIQKAIDGVDKVAASFPGIKNIWTNAVKHQTVDWAIAMEFESLDALKKYAGSEAQKEWYKVYMPVREVSITHDITN